MASRVNGLTLLHRDLNRLRKTFDWQGGELFTADKTLAKTAEIFAESLDLIQQVQRQMDGVIGKESGETHLDDTRIAIMSSFSDFALRVKSLHDKLQAAPQKPVKEYKQHILRIGDSIRAIILLTHAHLVHQDPDYAAVETWNDAKLPSLPEEEAAEVPEQELKHKAAGQREDQPPVLEGFPFAPAVSVDWLSATWGGTAAAASGEQTTAAP